jgi:ABC-type multidrug transport system fused ATPase/permease subunit
MPSLSPSASAPQLLKPDIKGDIQFCDVTFSYASRANAPVLKAFNLHIPAGDNFETICDA